MGSNGGDEVMISSCCETDCSEATTIEIKIKTLDSQTYSLQVDKCVPVPALKEQIATVTGVVSEQQRLICRGRVLKDDQLLSAYHVEDGHTLHLVVRQPISTTFEDMPNDPASAGTDTFSSPHYNQAGPRIMVGTVNLSEQGDGVFPELSHIFSAVLGSFGVNNIGSSSEGINNVEVARERLSRTFGPNGLEVSGREPDHATLGNWSDPLSGVSTPLSSAVPLETLQPQVVPDSLTTLSQYLSHLRNEFSANVNGLSNNLQAANTQRHSGQESNAASSASVGQNGVPTPSSLAEVLLSTREVLTQQVAECLSQLARQLVDQLNTTNPLTRRNIQVRSLSVGVLLHNLGALLLELGRTTMTLRMGQTPGDAVVNAGPAMFISPSGPTPIMVQPPQLGSRAGAIPSGNMQSASGFLPRNVDIRFRSGSSAPTVLNQREPSDTRQTPEQTNPALSGGANSAHQTAGRNPSSTRESGVRVVPIRAVVATVPAAVRHPPSDSTRHPIGVLYPVIARVQHVTSRNLNSVSQAHPQHGRNEQLPRMSPGEQIHASGDGDFNFQGPPTSSFSPNAGISESNAATRGPEPQVSDEGAFLSNLLHQILPLVSQNRSTESNIASTNETNVSDNSNRQTSTTQAQENSDAETSSRRQPQANLPTPPSSKRQKRD